MRSTPWLLLAATCVAVLAPGPAAAQDPVRDQVQDTVDARIREARELREERSFLEAAERLRAYLRDHPGDAGVLRLLASTLRSGGRLQAAREVYEEALRRQPIDPLLRLDYGDLLVELSAGLEARRVLNPVLASERVPASVRADARVLIGRLERRAGEVAAAESEFRTALDLQARHPGALRELRQIYRPRVPRVGVGIDRADDDQPVGQTRFGLDGRRGVLPWLDGTAGTGIRIADGEESDETVPDVRGGVVARWDLLSLEARAWGGAFRRSLSGDIDWQAGGEVAFLGPGGLRIRAHARRVPYLRTEASLDAALTPTVFGGSVGRPEVTGWAGNLEYRQERFRGDVEVEVEELWAWLLAPVLRDRGGTLRIGYEFHGADASEMLFVPAVPEPIPFQGPIPGRYDPVYTPEQLQSHSLLVDVRVETEGTLEGALEGAWGFASEEEAPLLFASVPEVPGAGVGLQFERRSFDPWRIEASVRYLPLPVLEVTARSGYRSDAFRSYSFFGLGATLFDLPLDLR